jgi:hypothetical protein
MLFVFITSITTVIFVLVVAYLESATGKRFGGLPRRKVDRFLTRIAQKSRAMYTSFFETAHREYLIKTLHIITYLALVCVRYIEHKLEKLTAFFRSFRKKKTHVRKKRHIHEMMRDTE